MTDGAYMSVRGDEREAVYELFDRLLQAAALRVAVVLVLAVQAACGSAATAGMGGAADADPQRPAVRQVRGQLMSRYACILADPPWEFRDVGTRLAPSHEGRHYEVLSLRELVACGALVNNLSARDAFLWLWAPNALVIDGSARAVCRAWGFEPKQLIPWLKVDSAGKPRMGGGHYTRVCTEMLVLARRGRATVTNRSTPGVILAERGRHSAKPDESYALIERLCEGPRLELYARRRYSEEWTAWGNEVQS